ncbi:hypothetical protein [Furfurilactobacillus entadae]|uniref:hypothetical protein n=1 Tax=Furfurilactobacillus entadae TaxID=2922307 RepID=UPI0035F0657E
MTETKEQQACEYCHEPFNEFGDAGGFKIVIQPLMCWHSLVSVNVYSEEEMLDDCAINFCPICGRKLEVEHE